MATATRMRRIPAGVFAAVRSQIVRARSRALDTLVVEMTNDVLGTITTPYPPASKPGQPPHMRSQFLFNNTAVERKGNAIFVRTPQYGIWLEGGTGNMLARPFIRPRIHDRMDHWRSRLRELMQQEIRR